MELDKIIITKFYNKYAYQVEFFYKGEEYNVYANGDLVIRGGFNTKVILNAHWLYHYLHYRMKEYGY